MSLIQKIIRKKFEFNHLSAFGNGYLRAKGWQKSFCEEGSVNDRSEPIPWITYPCLMMLRRVVQPHFKVFEYGCGNSSLWWASRVSEIVSVEHDLAWAEKVKRSAPGNLRVIPRPKGASSNPGPLIETFFDAYPDLPDATSDKAEEHGFDCINFTSYASEAEQFGRHYFDIFIVDGMARSLTAYIAAQLVRPNGLIVFDNSERWQYNPGFVALSGAGFARIDFYGPGPLSTHEHCTSIFARDLDWAKTKIQMDGIFDSSV